MEKPIRLYQIVRTKIGGIPCQVNGDLNNLHLTPCFSYDIIHAGLKGVNKPIKNGKELYEIVYPVEINFLYEGQEPFGAIVPNE